MRFYLLIIFALAINFLSAQNLSNKGKEFWVGYGHHYYMEISGGTTNSQEMVLYLSAEQAATVKISVGANQIALVSIPANTVDASIIIPKSGTNDARLFTSMGGVNEGLYNRGIHIESDVPIVAYAHIYSGTSSGATMLMPVETYGYTYYALCSPQNFANNCYSWFYIVANFDNTVVEITPSAPTRGGWTTGSVNRVTLNKGQIYQVLGSIQSGTIGYDLTGSKIKSVSNSNGDCYPIAVFSGSSRTMFCPTGSSTNGGDNMMQQIFPASAWGTKYLTYPTVATTNAFPTTTPVVHNNKFRVAVRDPNTVVKRNGIVLTGLINGFYYEFASNQPEFIDADKPIMVAQYMGSQDCSGVPGASSYSDPEMIYLSPVEQGIKQARFYANSKDAIQKGYLNIIIPSAGVNSLTIDGSNSFSANMLHPRNSGYRIVIKEITLNNPHSIQSDSAFTAITYGMGSFESYGYNAGTLVNNLEAIPAIQNSLNTSNAENEFTCKNTPFRFSIKLTFKPTQIVWKFSLVAGLSPNTDTIVNNPVAIDSFFIGSQRYYTFKLQKDYRFTNTGTFNIPVFASSPEIDNCNNTLNITNYQVKVNQGPGADFSWTYGGCVNDTAYFSGTAIPGSFSNINRFYWLFDDGTVDSVQNTKKKFNATGNHPTKLQVVAGDGCFGDTIKIVTTTSPIATLGMSQRQACGSATVTFTDTSSFAGTTLNEFYWDFGNGTTLTTNTNASQTQTYNTPGTYIIQHWAGVQNGCRSATKIDTLHVYQIPSPAFIAATDCVQDSTVQFTDNTPALAGQALSWSWVFDDANANASNPNTSSIQNPTHKYSTYGPFNIKLKITTDKGCTAEIIKQYSISGFAPIVSYSVANEANLCVQKAVQVQNEMNISRDSIYRIDIYWDFTNQPGSFATDNNPVQNETYNHTYTNFTTPASKTITIKWLVYGKGGCLGEKTKQITLHATPALSVSFVPGKCINAPQSNIKFAAVTNGLTGNETYYGTGLATNGDFTPSAAGTAGVVNIGYTFTSNFGCMDSIPNTVRVFPKPTATFTVAPLGICTGDSVRLGDASSVSAGSLKEWHWNFGDGNSVVKNDPGVFYKTFASFGNYNIKLNVVSDSLCASDTLAALVKVESTPQPDFEFPLAICMSAAGGVVQFTNKTTIDSGNPDSLHYSWDFDDLSNSTNQHPLHNYAAAGTYNVKLVASTNNGCSKEIIKVVDNFFEKPVADFMIDKVEVCQGKAVLFKDTSTSQSSTITGWLWDFDNGSTDTTKNPEFIFVDTGSYNVSLIVTSAEGCNSDPHIQTIHVNKQPIVNAGEEVIYLPDGTTVLMQAVTNDPALRIKWTPNIDFLTVDTILNPAIQPRQDRLYKITATGASGCYDVDSVWIKVMRALRIPNAFSPNNDGINDQWQVFNFDNYPNARVSVYDRFGNMVYSNKGFFKPWDGKANGKDLPIGTYYYIIEPNGNGYGKLSGSITLLR